MTLPERDWKHLRSLHQLALDRYCERVLDESRVILADEAGSAHDRCLARDAANHPERDGCG